MSQPTHAATSAAGTPTPAERVAAALAHPLLATGLLLELCALVAWGALAPIADPDFGWHVALGRWMVEHGAVPSTDPLTHTAAGAPEVVHEWLTEVGYHLVEQAGGVLALRWLHVVLAVAIVVLVFRLCRRVSAPPWLALAGTFLYLVVAQGRLQVRPHLVDLLALVSVYGLLFVGRPRLHARQLVWVLFATVLWANLHAGAVLLPALAWLHLWATALDRVLRRPARPDELGGGDLRRLLALAVVTTAGVLATPAHVRLVPYVLESYRLNARYSVEWQPLLAMAGWPELTPLQLPGFAVLAVASAAVALVSFRRHGLASVAVPLYLAFAPLRGERFTAGTFAAVVLVCGAVAAWLAAPAATTIGTRVRRWLPAAAVAAILAGAIPILDHHGALRGDGTRLGAAGNFAAGFPVHAVEILEEAGLEGRLFAQAEWGGFISYRTFGRRQVFADGRWVTVGETVLRDAATIERGLPRAVELLDAYGIELAVLGRRSPTRELARARGWVEVFADRTAAVLVRPGSAGAERAARYLAAQGISFAPGTGFDPAAAIRANPAWAARFGVHEP